MDSTTKRKVPLEGIRVLDLGTFIAAPYAATILGEFGAEVIKVENPVRGDPLREFGTPSKTSDTLCWLSEARNKKSVTLDLRKARGSELFLELVERSDLICESFRPGTLEKWGLGFDRLKQRNPNIIMLRVSGFGQSGPLRQRTGFARVAHAFGGLAYLTGLPGGPPLTPGSTSLADYISGLYGAIGLLVALHARDEVGGQYIDLALYESIFRILDDLVPSYAAYGTVRGPVGLGTSNACPHGHFKCKDARWIALACSSDKIFSRFAHLIGKPELASDEMYGLTQPRIENRDEIDRIVNAWLQQHTSDEVVNRCAEADVPCALVNTIEDIFQCPHVEARENILRIEETRTGTLAIPNVVPKLSETPGRIRHAGPPLGSSNDDVYGTLLGLSDEEITRLAEDGVI